MNKGILLLVWALTAATAYYLGMTSRPATGSLDAGSEFTRNQGDSGSAKVPPLPPRPASSSSSAPTS